MIVSDWVYIIGILLIAFIGWFYIRLEIRRRDELAFVVSHLTPLLQDFFAWGPKVERRGSASVIVQTKSSRNLCKSPYLHFGRASEVDVDRYDAVRTLYIDAEVLVDEESERVVRIEVRAHTVRSSDWIISFKLITPEGFVLPKPSMSPYLDNDRALRELVYRSRKYLTRTRASTA